MSKCDIPNTEKVANKDSINIVSKSISKADLLEMSQKINYKIDNSMQVVKEQVIEDIKSGKVDPYNTRELRNEEIRRMFIYTFKIAQQEIDIISPWISNWVFNDKELLEGIKMSLARGVMIKIIYGIGSDNSTSTKENNKRNLITQQNANRLQNQFYEYKDYFILKRGNTHQKILLCDEKYYMEGSYNLLSFRGDYQREDVRAESMTYMENSQ